MSCCSHCLLLEMAAGLLTMSLPCYCVSCGAVIYSQEGTQSTESFRLEEFSWNLLTLIRYITIMFGKL